MFRLRQLRLLQPWLWRWLLPLAASSAGSDSVFCCCLPFVAFINTNINFCGTACGRLVYTDAIGKRLCLGIYHPLPSPHPLLLAYQARPARLCCSLSSCCCCVYLIKVKGAQHALQFAWNKALRCPFFCGCGHNSFLPWLWLHFGHSLYNLTAQGEASKKISS